jgi:hypothetical protein
MSARRPWLDEPFICDGCGRRALVRHRTRDGKLFCLRCFHESLNRQWDERRKRRLEEPES